VNLGIGIPTLIPNYIPKDYQVTFHSENGILGLGGYPKRGEEDPELINAGKETVKVTKGASYFSSSDSFLMIRGHHLDMTCLGALQVDQDASLASWWIKGSAIKGMGGAMDLVQGAKKVCIMMQHSAKGKSKVLKKCGFELTGIHCVDMLVTDKGMFSWKNGCHSMTLEELAPGVSLEELKALTEAEFIVSPTLREYQISI
jgi:3-oxoacid CoA-transferase subunit B